MEIMEILNADIYAIGDVEKLNSMLDVLQQAETDKYNSFEDFVENLDTKDKARLYQSYAEATNNETFYTMDMIDEVMCDLPFSEAIRKIDKQKFDIDHEIFWYDRFGDIVSGSIDEFVEENFYTTDIVQWLERCDYEDGCGVISDFVDELTAITEKIDEVQEQLEEIG